MKKIIWLRISYWTGAIFDFLIAIGALIPTAMGLNNFVHPMGTFSAAAASWEILLLFANKKPLERKWVLIPTVIIVVLGLCAGIYSSFNGLRPIQILIPEIIVGLLCITLWIYSYIITNDIEEQ